jgi:MFS family permease
VRQAQTTLDDHELERAKVALVADGAWASAIGVMAGSVILVGFALQLGASPLVIGLLAAIPFIGQFAQLPAILLVQRLRNRRKLAVRLGLAERFVILAFALLPLLPNKNTALILLIGGQLIAAALAATSACAWNSWMHDLLPKEGMGAFFARRLFWATTVSLIAGLSAGALVDNWRLGEQVHAYSVTFILAALAGFVSSWYLAQVPEPAMPPDEGVQPLWQMIRQPLADTNFRRLIRFMASYNFATNFAGPFVTVFLLQHVALGIGAVVVLGAVSQLANVLTIRLWGNLSDRFSNKSVLAVTVPTFFACLLALPFTAHPVSHSLTLPLLAALHVVMGIAAGGSGLAIANIGLQLAPRGQGTAYMAAVGLLSACAAAIAPVLGGVVADWFLRRELAISVQWTSPGTTQSFALLNLQHWDFFFLVAFTIGLYALHRLSLVREEGHASRRVVVQNLVLEARRNMRSLSSIGGLRIAIVFPYGKILGERRSERFRRKLLVRSVRSQRDAGTLAGI